MKINNASLLSLGAAPWKFILLAATLAFHLRFTRSRDDHEEAPVTTEEASAEEAGPVDDYQGSFSTLKESEGFAYDFFTTSMLDCNCSSSRIFNALRLCHIGVWLMSAKECGKCFV